MMMTDRHPAIDLAVWESMWQDVTPDESVWIVDGPATRLYVTGGSRDRSTKQVTGQSLVIVDGPRDSERTRVIHAIRQPVKHLVILSSRGNLSTDAQRFLADNRITWAVIDVAGKTPRTLSHSGTNIDAKLMRKQAMCAEGFPLEETGLDIIRGFIVHKLEGQAWNAEVMLNNPALAAVIRSRIDSVMASDNLESIRGHEGGAADAYWAAWKGLQPRWHKASKVLKPHWLSFPGRKSLRRSETNRRATDPINALLNFAYHCAETECVIALQSAGLDPRMGISHVDTDGRSSFALDLIEVIRPRVDEAILNLLRESLDPRCFWSDREGIVRVSAPLTHRVASDVRAASRFLTPDVKRVKDLLATAVV